MLAGLWFVAVVGGLAGVAIHANRAGIPARAPSTWPTDSALARDTARPTLVMLVHPKCDCTRASLAELTKLMTRAAGHVTAYVVVMRPGGVADAWEEGQLQKTASHIPGVSVVVDRGGVEVDRFGAETSGQTLLYAADGTLTFSGGTTIARGHEGDSPGVAAMLAAIGGDHQAPAAAPVFGCELHNSPVAPTE